MNYKNSVVHKFDEKFKEQFKLKEIRTDSHNWRTFYESNGLNWILFYPNSNYHGGGQPYIVNIGSMNFNDWIDDNKEFENEIKELIEK